MYTLVDCECCLKGKIKWIFLCSHTKTDKLGVLNVDTTRQFEPKCVGDHGYFLTIVYEHNRYLEARAQVEGRLFSVISNVCILLRMSDENDRDILHVDGGSEFTHAVNDLRESCVVVYLRTRYTYQSNG